MKFVAKWMFMSFCLFAPMAQAAVTSTGSIDPDLNTWGWGTDAYIGYIADGTLTVDGGSTVVTYGSSLGYSPNVTGTVTISGAGSRWETSSGITVGAAGFGELSLLDGGMMVCEGDTNLGTGGRAVSAGTVTVSGAGSKWSISGMLTVGAWSKGQLTITNGGVVENSTGFIGRECVLPVSTVAVSGVGSKWTNQNLHVGDDEGFGNLSITDGGLVSVAGSLWLDHDDGLEVGYHEDAVYINMSTGGMLALDGQAESSLTAFLDLVYESDEIRWWDTSIGDWAHITTAIRDVDYTLEYLTQGELAGCTLLTVGTAPSIAGDANGDGRVDGSDVTILAGNWQYGVGMAEPDATWAMGDFNGDGCVDGSDVTILAGNWQYGVEAPATAVPEPGGVVLLLTTLLAAGLVPALKTRDGKRRR